MKTLISFKKLTLNALLAIVIGATLAAGTGCDSRSANLGKLISPSQLRTQIDVVWAGQPSMRGSEAIFGIHPASMLPADLSK
jgi:hypothetical protein